MQRSRTLLRAVLSLPAADVVVLLRGSPSSFPPLLLQPAKLSLDRPCRRFGSLLSGRPLWNSIHQTLTRAVLLKHSILQSRTFLGLGDSDEDAGVSKQHEETRVVGYTPEQLFSVVAAVDTYQEFVPWCQGSTVLWQRDNALEAELEIGFKFFVERYKSHVELIRPSLIKTSVSESNLFEYLTNIWEFKPGPKPGTCNVHFSVKFQFRSPFYHQAASMFFQEVVSRLVGSFEDRCNKVYGPSTKVLENTQAA